MELVGTNMGSKIDVNIERRIFKKCCFSKEKQSFLRPRGSTNQEQIKKIRSKNEAKMGIALGIDFFMDFPRFWEASWSQVDIKNR